MKKRNLAALAGSVCAVVVLAHLVLGGPQERPLSGEFAAEMIDPIDIAATTANGLNYATSFEPNEGFSLGYISNMPGGHPAGCGSAAFPCWGHTTAADASLITPTISDANPASGMQHLRLMYDPATRTNQPNFSLGVDARYPRSADVSPRPIASNSVSMYIAISNPGGMNYRIQTQSNSQGCVATSALFMEDGSISILDDLCGTTTLGFQPTGAFWDTTGGYQNYTVDMNSCHNSISYVYGGAGLYYSCVFAGHTLEQLLIYGDNSPGSYMDIDNLSMSSQDGCPSSCGNAILEYPSEDCDTFNDENCPGRCQEDCTCAPICTRINPCAVTNGANGPFVTSDGYYLYSGTSPSISIDTCGSDFDSALSVTAVTAPGTVLSSNDNCDVSQYGAGADESASCYDDVSPFSESSASCACLANPGQPILIRVQSLTPSCLPLLGEKTMVTVRKKAACAGDSVGSCCDTNGADQGCTDDTAQPDCIGVDKIWTDQGKCVDQVCECIPDCTGATCGPHGCGGSCGSCDDQNACNGLETCNANRTCDPGQPLVCNDGNACNGVETCNPASGCRPGAPLRCDDQNACNGIETCNPASGCIPGLPVNCDDGVECTVDACNEFDGSCSHDDADCFIPTVSLWGLAVLTLVLLIGAKLMMPLPSKEDNQ